MTFFEAFLDFALPTPCAFCSKPGSPVCRACRVLIGIEMRAISRSNLRGFALTCYGDVERKLLKAFKEDGQSAVVGYISELVAPSLEAVLTKLSPAEGGFSGNEKVVLVPLPSSKANFIKRGFAPAELIARKSNRRAGNPFVVRPLLSFCRPVHDQSQLSLAERRANLANSMVAKRPAARARILLIDDVVTSGASVNEAARALTEAGAEVLGFLVFSETILKTATKS